MHSMLVPSLDHRISMQSSRSSNDHGKTPQPFVYKHRRDSSLSTSASISSNHTRVLPFAAFGTHNNRLQPISPIQITSIPETHNEETSHSSPRVCINNGQAKILENNRLYYQASGHSRFALAQPRRVVTVNGPATKTLLLADIEPREVTADKRTGSCARGKRRSAAIGISTILPNGTGAAVSNTSVASSNGGLSSTRARPIIGLGLTLNPADTLVTLQTRCRRRNAQPRAVTDPQTIAELAECARDKKQAIGDGSRKPIARITDTNGEEAPESPNETLENDVLFDLALLSPLDIMKSCVSLVGSPRNLDPELISLARRRSAKLVAVPQDTPNTPDVQMVPAEDNAETDQEQETPHIVEPTEPLPGDELQHSVVCLQKPDGPEPTELTCLLCFERVLVPRKRTIAMRCPGCLTSLV
ncbi:hypothetical protein H4R99_000978 [Coemansia sp. RSA 1722]|nr:hypothetical protein LPJ57_001395 [Coemansia sp. RSA 486]KAJ2233532.1 hypothetical protein IWW45_004111 [Coemansia sp. RSA 485]KAJ2605633.1 hypothetical protein H4R99_000978 [Coemansia sp. RSA 1722]